MSYAPVGGIWDVLTGEGGQEEESTNGPSWWDEMWGEDDTSDEEWETNGDWFEQLTPEGGGYIGCRVNCLEPDGSEGPNYAQCMAECQAPPNVLRQPAKPPPPPPGPPVTPPPPAVCPAGTTGTPPHCVPIPPPVAIQPPSKDYTWLAVGLAAVAVGGLGLVYLAKRKKTAAKKV